MTEFGSSPRSGYRSQRFPPRVRRRPTPISEAPVREVRVVLPGAAKQRNREAILLTLLLGVAVLVIFLMLRS